MHKLGNILAFAFNKIFIVVLVLLFVAFIPVIGVASTLTKSENVKTILDEADVYTTVPKNLIDIIEVDEDGQTRESPGRTLRQVIEENGVIDADALIAVVMRIFDRESLQKTAEAGIDSFYAYLEGESNELNFTVSVEKSRKNIEADLKSFFSSSFEELQVCSNTALNDGGDFSLLELACQPLSAELDRQVSELVAEVVQADGTILEVGPEDADVAVDLNTVFLRTPYELLKNLSWLFWIAAVGLSFSVVLTARSTHRGFKEIGIIYGLLGIIFLVLFGFFSSAVRISDVALQNADDFSDTQLEAIHNITDPLSEAFQANVAGNITVLAVIMIVVGVAAYILGIVLTKHHVEHVGLHQHESDSDTQSVYPTPTKGRLAAHPSTDKSVNSKSVRPKKKD